MAQVVNSPAYGNESVAQENVSLAIPWGRPAASASWAGGVRSVEIGAFSAVCYFAGVEVTPSL